jgi:prevent-host-death family protein
MLRFVVTNKESLMAMKAGMELFTARDLRTRSSELVREAEQGRLSIITKRGRPAALALPFDQRLVKLGLAQDLAVSLFEMHLVTMAKAAKIAGLTLDAFMDLLAQTSVTAVDYPAGDLRKEMGVAL